MTASPAVFRVLFVCIGNVCRSPLGERLLAAKLPADRFVLASAGVNGLEGAPMDRHTAAQLASMGADGDDFVARRLSEAMVEEADLILTATRDIRSRVLEDVPSALRRTFTVREFAALLDEVADTGQDLCALVAAAAAARSSARLDDYDIPDPFRRSVETHAQAARLMAAAVDRIAKGLRR